MVLLSGSLLQPLFKFSDPEVLYLLDSCCVLVSYSFFLLVGWRKPRWHLAYWSLLGLRLNDWNPVVSSPFCLSFCFPPRCFTQDLWFGFVYLFNSISTLFNAKAILREEQLGYYLPHCRRDKRVRYIFLVYSSESEHNSATGVRTRLLRGCTPVCLTLHHRDSFQNLWLLVGCFILRHINPFRVIYHRQNLWRIGFSYLHQTRGARILVLIGDNPPNRSIYWVK